MEKRNSNLLLRISDQQKTELQAYLSGSGIGSSELLRAMIAREVSHGDLLRGLDPEPLGPDHHMIRVRDLTGREWNIHHQTDGIWPYLFLRGPGGLEGDILRFRDLPEEHLGPLLSAFRAAESHEFDWDDKVYRDLCKKFRIDPDRARPVFANRDKPAARSLLHILETDRNSPRGAAAETLWKLLRKNRTINVSDWERVMEPRGYLFEARMSCPILRRIARRIRPPSPQEAKREPPGLVMFLPSRHRAGSRLTTYPGEIYDTKGVAVIPDLSLIRNRLLKATYKPGITWLTPDEALRYMREDGARWDYYHGGRFDALPKRKLGIFETLKIRACRWTDNFKKKRKDSYGE